jgi:hypothetical protein
VSIKELAQYDPKAGLITHHAISPYHCRPFTCPSTKQPSPYLSAGVITALFDEVPHTQAPGDGTLYMHIHVCVCIYIPMWSVKSPPGLTFYVMCDVW